MAKIKKIFFPKISHQGVGQPNLVKIEKFWDTVGTFQRRIFYYIKVAGNNYFSKNVKSEKFSSNTFFIWKMERPSIGQNTKVTQTDEYFNLIC